MKNIFAVSASKNPAGWNDLKLIAILITSFGLLALSGESVAWGEPSYVVSAYKFEGANMLPPLRNLPADQARIIDVGADCMTKLDYRKGDPFDRIVAG